MDRRIKPGSVPCHGGECSWFGPWSGNCVQGSTGTLYMQGCVCWYHSQHTHAPELARTRDGRGGKRKPGFMSCERGVQRQGTPVWKLAHLLFSSVPRSLSRVACAS